VLPYGFPILLVGSREIHEEYQSKVTMVRDLPHQIEHEPKLLSFTAWYAISKNNLFPECDHICILEWDVVLDKDFLPLLQELCDPTVDAVSFVEVNHSFTSDISIPIADQFLKQKGISYLIGHKRWGCSTNQCLRRSLLDEFVDWYFPSCLLIKHLDEPQFSWYHERLYMIFLDLHSMKYKLGKGLRHLFADSHKELNH
jgi:hypothetical protein